MTTLRSGASPARRARCRPAACAGARTSDRAASSWRPRCPGCTGTLPVAHRAVLTRHARGDQGDAVRVGRARLREGGGDLAVEVAVVGRVEDFRDHLQRRELVQRRALESQAVVGVRRGRRISVGAGARVVKAGRQAAGAGDPVGAVRPMPQPAGCWPGARFAPGWPRGRAVVAPVEGLDEAPLVGVAVDVGRAAPVGVVAADVVRARAGAAAEQGLAEQIEVELELAVKRQPARRCARGRARCRPPGRSSCATASAC